MTNLNPMPGVTPNLAMNGQAGAQSVQSPKAQAIA